MNFLCSSLNFLCSCNINRKIGALVEHAGFDGARLDRFRAKGLGIAAQMYRGVAACV